MPGLNCGPRGDCGLRPDRAARKKQTRPTEAALVTTLDLEKEINTFFRLTGPSVIARLRDAFPDLPDRPSPMTAFLKLRELTNKW